MMVQNNTSKTCLDSSSLGNFSVGSEKKTKRQATNRIALYFVILCKIFSSSKQSWVDGESIFFYWD